MLFNNYGYHSQKSGVPRYFPEGFAVKNQDFIGISINPSPDYAMVARAFEGYGEKVEDPGEVRAALQRGLKAVAGGQMALIDIRLAKRRKPTRDRIGRIEWRAKAFLDHPLWFRRDVIQYASVLMVFANGCRATNRGMRVRPVG